MSAYDPLNPTREAPSYKPAPIDNNVEWMVQQTEDFVSWRTLYRGPKVQAELRIQGERTEDEVIAKLFGGKATMFHYRLVRVETKTYVES